MFRKPALRLAIFIVTVLASQLNHFSYFTFVTEGNHLVLSCAFFTIDLFLVVILSYSFIYIDFAFVRF